MKIAVDSRPFPSLVCSVLFTHAFVVVIRGDKLPPYVFEADKPKSINLGCDYERQMQQYLTQMANNVTSCDLNRVRRVRCAKSMVRDGNGLFRSISYLLYRDESRFNDVRKNIVDYVVQNWAHYEPWIVGSDVYSIDVDSVDYYEWYMGSNGTWGSEVELNAATRIYNLRLRVYSDRTNFYEMGEESNMTYALLYSGNGYNGYYQVVEDVFKSCPPKGPPARQRNSHLSKQALKLELQERRRQAEIQKQEKNQLSHQPVTETKGATVPPAQVVLPPETVEMSHQRGIDFVTSRDYSPGLAESEQVLFTRHKTNEALENSARRFKKPAMDPFYLSPMKQNPSLSIPVLVN